MSEVTGLVRPCQCQCGVRCLLRFLHDPVEEHDRLVFDDEEGVGDSIPKAAADFPKAAVRRIHQGLPDGPRPLNGKNVGADGLAFL